MILVAVTGTNGSGKGTVVDFLVKEKGFKHYAARDFLTKEVLRRGLTLDRSSMRDVANELRATYEPAYVVKSLYEEAVKNEEVRVVIESVRNTGEAKFLRENGALLIAVDANQTLRYERVQSRRSATDKVDFATFVEHEEREMHPVGPHDMDLRGVMRLADVTIVNDGPLADLHKKVESALDTSDIR
jgi:dephospho-CoA kinase